MRIGGWALLAALASASAMTAASAAPPEKAAIVNSGSTNTAGYRIDVSSDGTGTLTMQAHPRSDLSTKPKPFRVETALAARFFNDVKAVRGIDVQGKPCMKSASFGTSTHITYNGWTSPDLECPSPNELMNSLMDDVRAIRKASGVGEAPGMMHAPGPLRVLPTTSPKPPG